MIEIEINNQDKKLNQIMSVETQQTYDKIISNGASGETPLLPSFHRDATPPSNNSQSVAKVATHKLT